MADRRSRPLLQLPVGRLLALLWLLLAAQPAHAGGGPENVFLVVNSASWASQCVANHFIAKRQIPSNNVFFLEWTGGIEIAPGGDFRDKILVPILDALERRNLRGQIDYVVYSSDFPCGADLNADFPNVKFPPQLVPVCSINSATYLWNLVLARQPILVDLRINHYMRAFVGRETEFPSHGFRQWYGWGNRGELLEAGGQPYLLSTVLAITSGRGNSVKEAISYLDRSVTADGTRPKGTVYFSRTDDVRSKTRADQFAPAVKALKELGVKAQVIDTVLPNKRRDVIGAMIGVNEFSWKKSGSTILPGAICENFTSFGGMMHEGASQTPLTELLRYGAAGASGTVVEPYAQPEKFPSPQIHVHYARGCSLAEAYYQSLFAPGQMLIVGDPLCQPWADIPQVTLDSPQPGAKVSGKVPLKPQAKFVQGRQLDRWELFVDGKRVAAGRPNETITWDTTAVGDGYHELRLVAIEAGPIETQGRIVLGTMVDNQKRSIEVKTTPSQTVRLDEKLQVSVKAPGASRVMLVANGRSLGQLNGAAGTITVNPRHLGLGPVEFQAVAGENARERFQSAPIKMVVAPPRALPAIKDVPGKLGPGMLLQLPSKKVVPIQQTLDPTWIQAAGLGPDQAFAMQGFFEVGAEDVYQFQVWHFGTLRLSVDGQTIYEGKNGDYTQKFVPVALAAGKHRLSVTGTTGQDLKLRLLFGGPGAMSLSGSMFKHPMK